MTWGNHEIGVKIIDSVKTTKRRLRTAQAMLAMAIVVAMEPVGLA